MCTIRGNFFIIKICNTNHTIIDDHTIVTVTVVVAVKMVLVAVVTVVGDVMVCDTSRVSTKAKPVLTEVSR